MAGGRYDLPILPADQEQVIIHEPAVGSELQVRFFPVVDHQFAAQGFFNGHIGARMVGMIMGVDDIIERLQIFRESGDYSFRLGAGIDHRRSSAGDQQIAILLERTDYDS